MEFKLKETDTFLWDCKAKVPQGKKHVTIKFEAEFEPMPQEEMQQMLKDAPTAEQGTVDVLRRVLVNYSGFPVEDESGNSIAEDDAEERKRIILRKPYLVKGLSDGYAHGIAGYRAKN